MSSAPRATRTTLLVLLAALLLLGAQTLVWSLRTPTLAVDMAARQTNGLLTGFHATEHDPRGAYRWTAGASTLAFAHVGQGERLVLRLRLGPAPPAAAPPAFTVRYGNSPPTALATGAQPRHYALLVPPGAQEAGGLAVHLASATATVAPDPRPVGLRLEGVSLAFIGAPLVLPAPGFAALQLVLLALAGGMLFRLRRGWRLEAATLLLAAGALLLLTLRYELVAQPYLVNLGLLMAVLLLLTYALLPACERWLAWLAPPDLMRALWGVALLACGLRLVGSMYPLFDAFDLGLNLGRLSKTLAGELYVTSRSLEFRNNFTIYPPGPYITLAPGLLAGFSPKLAVQGGLAIIDGFGALTTALLVRQLGLSARAALISALLFAAIPIHLTALWFGLTAQIFGQALMAPLAMVLLVALRAPHRERLLPWLLAGVLLLVSLLSHIGVAVVVVGWLGLAWLLLAGWRPVRWRVWWSFTWMLLLCGLISFTLLYSTVVLLKIRELADVGEKLVESTRLPAYNLIERAFRISFHELGYYLLPPALLLLLRRRLPPGAPVLLWAWLGTVAVFWGIEMLTALQVRYIYFLTPLACAALALLLDKLTRPATLTARALLVAVLLLLTIQGSLTWYAGTFADIMPSMSPLLR